jgi:hypothetical protein
MQQVLDGAAVGAGREDVEGLDLGLVEQRVLAAHHARHRQDSQAPMLLVIGGYAGSGKTELGRLLATMTGWPLLDKDILTHGLILPSMSMPDRLIEGARPAGAPSSLATLQ